ncbi:ATP-binding protein [Mucilaginibacter sp. ZT4R22]|uniref:ATP-binding protein n=1 Tax=Mucilaginibacter pankratovii TaxID=2772110 RepID=A0ABR7WSU7_9SPHI|nr:ATP-binding protein [Mucilaginibacter pankratovii]MBD1365378.1 ATP-binding protein [Mucilaginibacter pankratovii]
MNQDLLFRLFRSIDGEQTDDIVMVAESIIADERKKGHNRLADRLAGILQKNIKNNQSFKGELRQIFGSSIMIPTDNRSNIPLAVEVPAAHLRREMILSDEVDEKIVRIEKEYLARERLAHYGLKPRRRILFHGHPGCGKSMSAERIAWNIGLPFLKVKFEAVVSSYLGESASNLTKLFESIKTFPCVLLLDEFDFIAKSRGDKQDVGEMHRVVNILLNVLEEFNGPGLIIATTNLEGTLDKALFRRFDDIIEIPRPGKDEIKRLLMTTLSSIKYQKIDWDKIVTKLDQFSSAMVVKVATDAAKFAVIQGNGIVDQASFAQSLKENQMYQKN